MREPARRKNSVIAWLCGLSAMLLGSILFAACQSTPPAAPAAAPTAAKSAAPTAAPAVAPTVVPAAPAPTAAPAAAPATAAPAVAKEVTVKIGHLPSFTGAAAVMTEAMGKAVNDYFQWVNDQGGLSYKDPKTGDTMRAKFDVSWDDIAYDATRALNAYQKQKQAGVKAIVSVGGIVATTLADPASKDKIPVIVNTTPSDASLKPSPRYLMTSSMSFNRQAMAFVKYIKDGWKESRAPRLGIAHVDSPAGITGITGLPEYAKQIGWEVLPAEAITEPLTDASIQVKRLLGNKPDYVYSVSSANSVAVMMRDAVRLGVQGRTQWVVNGQSYDISVFQKVADAETSGVMSPIVSAMPSETNLAGVQLADSISRKYENVPLTNQLFLQQIGTLVVLVNGGLKGALEKVGYEGLTGEAVRNAMFSIKNLDTGGIYPSVTMTEDKPWIESKARLVQWKDHKTTIITDWMAGPE